MVTKYPGTPLRGYDVDAAFMLFQRQGCLIHAV